MGASNSVLEINADVALFSGQVKGIVATFHQNERPLHGLSGLLDWRLQGAISRQLGAGSLLGKQGECVYIPHTRHGITYHLLLIGAGTSAAPGARASLDPETLSVLRNNLANLKLDKMAVSRSDFGDVSVDYFSKHLKGISLWIAP